MALKPGDRFIRNGVRAVPRLVGKYATVKKVDSNDRVRMVFDRETNVRAYPVSRFSQLVDPEEQEWLLLRATSG